MKLARCAALVPLSLLLLAGCSPESSDGAEQDTSDHAVPGTIVRRESPNTRTETTRTTVPIPFEVDPSLPRVDRTPKRPAATETPPEIKAGRLNSTEYALLETNYGNIVLALDNEAAPVTVANFLRYAEEGFYNGTLIHRVIKGFLIQGGGYTEELQLKGTHSPIINEWNNGLENVRGAVAMSRGNHADSATSEFYINLQSSSQLDLPTAGNAGYAVFGQVISGMSVVDQIGNVDTGQKHDYLNTPILPVIITGVTRLSETDAKARQ